MVGAPGALQIVVPEADAPAAAQAAATVDGVAAVTPAMPASDGSGLVMMQALPTVDPSDPALGGTLDTLRGELPDSALVGGAPAENLDLQTALNDYLPIVIGVILVLGFLLLLVALQARWSR